MSAVEEMINLDPRNDRRTHFDDIEVVHNGRRFWFSVEVESRLNANGYRIVDRVAYQGKTLVMPPAFVDMFEEALQDDRLMEDE